MYALALPGPLPLPISTSILLVSSIAFTRSLLTSRLVSRGDLSSRSNLRIRLAKDIRCNYASPEWGQYRLQESGSYTISRINNLQIRYVNIWLLANLVVKFLLTRKFVYLNFANYVKPKSYTLIYSIPIAPKQRSPIFWWHQVARRWWALNPLARKDNAVVQ